MHEILWQNQPLYLETDASGIGVGTILLQTRDGAPCSEDTAPDNTMLRPIAFASKSLTGAEQRYSNIEREVLHVLHGLKKCHHYCFAREVSTISGLHQSHSLGRSYHRMEYNHDPQEIKALVEMAAPR